MGHHEIMYWKVNQDSPGWFSLEMNGLVSFKEFLSDVLDRAGSYGEICIQYDEKTYEMDYSHGKIIWISDNILEQIDNLIVHGGQAHGWHPQVDYHIKIG